MFEVAFKTNMPIPSEKNPIVSNNSAEIEPSDEALKLDVSSAIGAAALEGSAADTVFEDARRLRPEVKFVEMKEWQVADTSDQNEGKSVLTTIGIGPCIGITLYDPALKKGWMGHYANIVFERDEVESMLDAALKSADANNLQVWVRGGQSPAHPETMVIDFPTANKELLASILTQKGFSPEALDITYDERTWGEGATVQKLDVTTGQFTSLRVEAAPAQQQLAALDVLAPYN